MNINESLFERSEVGDTELLAQQLQGFREFTSCYVEPRILSIFLQSLGQRIWSLIGRHKDAAIGSSIIEIIGGLPINSCKVFVALWSKKIIWQINLLAPFSFW